MKNKIPRKFYRITVETNKYFRRYQGRYLPYTKNRRLFFPEHKNRKIWICDAEAKLTTRVKIKTTK